MDAGCIVSVLSESVQHVVCVRRRPRDASNTIGTAMEQIETEKKMTRTICVGKKNWSCQFGVV